MTTIEAGRTFYPAEAYHQDYMARNPADPYILINDRPKVAALRHLMPEQFRARPVLVTAAG